jgi:hypothetical protein
MKESVDKKLSPGSARDLATYLKLLAELDRRQKTSIEDMPVEELEKLVK